MAILASEGCLRVRLRGSSTRYGIGGGEVVSRKDQDKNPLRLAFRPRGLGRGVFGWIFTVRSFFLATVALTVSNCSYARGSLCGGHELPCSNVRLQQAV